MFWAANISEIRKLAEEKLGKQPTQLKKLTAQDAEKLIHELQVHQIELEIQNEELRTAQLALDEARQKYFDLYNLAPVGYITLSEDGLITGANQTAVKLFSVEKKQLENKPFTKFIISEDQNSFYLYKRQQLESNKQQQLELRLKKNHKVFWALLESVIIRNGNGSISMQVSIDNITARKQAEAELQLSEMKYRNLVDAMSEGLGVQDEDGKITFINKQGCDLLGYELDELIGKPITLVFDEENQKILQEQMILRHKGELQSYEIAWLRKDGRKIDTIIAPSPLFDDSGNFVGSAAVFTDITERKKTDALLEKTNRELSQLNAEKDKLFYNCSRFIKPIPRIYRDNRNDG